jgi:hypothetical protein
MPGFTCSGNGGRQPEPLGGWLAVPGRRRDRRLPRGIRFRPSYSKLNALPDLVPVVVCQPSNYAHITLKQGDQEQPKTRRCV